ncbi:signal recognition particle protein [Candidatus Woesearchaeota archaeon]|nr:signal recognition particle protein [Candidatus Woesearchaeota archaeon]
MVLDKLGDSLKSTLQKIAKSVFVDSKLVDELVKEIQRALLQSDVNVKLVLELTNSIRERALKEEAPAGLTKKEHVVNIVYTELVKFLGEEERQLSFEQKPTKIMLVGLFGSGKTTTAGKLGGYFHKRGKKVALVQLDVWRPAALDQLQQIGKKLSIPVFGKKGEKDPLKIYSEVEAELNKFDLVIVDTAGRDALSEELIEELRKINSTVKPQESLLVISADIGQTAEKQAKAFHETCDVKGVIITKLEGTAKGGGALSACSISGAPVMFIGVGEKLDDIERFNPKGFVGRLLGMGDIEALLEKAKEAISEEEAQDLGKKFLKGDFSLLELYEQMEAMKKMGPLKKVVEMIPGFGQLKMPKEMLDVQEGKLAKWKIAMQSMTKKELEDPEIISSTRIERIAKGSGVAASDIRELIKQYRQSKKLMKHLKNPDQMQRMMKRMGTQGFKMK